MTAAERARIYIHNYLEAYFGRRSLDETMLFLKDSLSGFGTGEDEKSRFRSEFQPLFTRDFEQMPGSIEYGIEYEHINRISDDVSAADLVLNLSSSWEGMEFEMPGLRMSIILKERGDSFLIEHMHASFPWSEQEGNESYPLKELEKQNRMLESLVKSRTAEIEEASRELSRLNELKDRVFSIIAHDLRGPFGSLTGLIEMVMEELDEGSEPLDIRQLLAEFNTGLKSTYLLIENLLEWAGSQIASEQAQHTSFFFDELIGNVREIYGRQINEKGIVLALEGPEKISITGDYHVINLVLRNIVSNAIKFVDRGGRIRVVYFFRDSFFCVRIEDNGVGIDGEKLAALSRKERRRSGTGTAGETGTGLGLYICREVLERQGGTLEIDSEPGRGTTVSASFPVPETE